MKAGLRLPLLVEECSLLSIYSNGRTTTAGRNCQGNSSVPQVGLVWGEKAKVLSARCAGIYPIVLRSCRSTGSLSAVGRSGDRLRHVASKRQTRTAKTKHHDAKALKRQGQAQLHRLARPSPLQWTEASFLFVHVADAIGADRKAWGSALASRMAMARLPMKVDEPPKVGSVCCQLGVYAGFLYFKSTHNAFSFCDAMA